MRLSSTNPKLDHGRKTQELKGNWMHLTIAPLVEERIVVKEPMPGMARENRPRKPR